MDKVTAMVSVPPRTHAELAVVVLVYNSSTRKITNLRSTWAT
jgi:hypothetical protein